MPDKEEAENTSELLQEANKGNIRKRLRPRWQRWLLWSSVRLLLLTGVGAGVGTVQWRRTRPSDLMAHARRIASIANVNGYYWTPKGELRLYQYAGKGTALLKWDPATQAAIFVEMLNTPKGKAFVSPMQEAKPQVQTEKWQDYRSQVKIIGAYKKEPSHTPGKATPEPDYLWKIKSLPNMPASLAEAALSSNGKRVAYVCLLPRMDWRDAIMQRLKRGYQAPFRGQGAAILVSAVDGSRTEVLGTVKEEMPRPHSQYSHSGKTTSLQCVCWCPDGKHLSFEYGDGVYEIAVK